VTAALGTRRPPSAGHQTRALSAAAPTPRNKGRACRILLAKPSNALNPRLLSCLAPYDVASNVRQALNKGPVEQQAKGGVGVGRVCRILPATS